MGKVQQKVPDMMSVIFSGPVTTCMWLTCPKKGQWSDTLITLTWIHVYCTKTY